MDARRRGVPRRDARADLRLPAEGGSNASLIALAAYARAADALLRGARALRCSASSAAAAALDLDAIWDGDGDNPNAALTVFRHFDSATVVQGLVGGPPKTAWVIGYPLLERIHYLLVAGFDVFGNVGHQSTRACTWTSCAWRARPISCSSCPSRGAGRWWTPGTRGAAPDVTEGLYRELTSHADLPNIRYRTRTPERELLRDAGGAPGAVRSHPYDLERIESAALRGALQRQQPSQGRRRRSLPELSFVAIERGQGKSAAHLLHSDARQRPHERRAAVRRGLAACRGRWALGGGGLLGAYPNALFSVSTAELGAFVDAVRTRDPELCCAAQAFRRCAERSLLGLQRRSRATTAGRYQ